MNSASSYAALLLVDLTQAMKEWILGKVSEMARTMSSDRCGHNGTKVPDGLSMLDYGL